MAKQEGVEKQNPPDQRGRGMNPQHVEGQDNARNHERQIGAAPTPPAPKP